MKRLVSTLLFVLTGLSVAQTPSLVFDQDGFPGAGEEKSLSPFFKLYLANGVTGIRDMGGWHLDWFVRMRQEVASGKRLGPRLITAGQALDGPHATDRRERG